MEVEDTRRRHRIQKAKYTHDHSDTGEATYLPYFYATLLKRSF